MKYIKYINLILFIVLGILTGCSKTNEEVISDTTYEEKLITGIAPVFDESLGYYNENPSVVRVSENLQYVYYTRNEIKYDSNSDSIAVRKAENVNGKWVYGNYKTILRPSNNSWDSLSVSSPDVVKGVFNYQGETYNYLMAYTGFNIIGRMNGQIGFAVSKSPDGEFIKVGSKPIIEFDKTDESISGIKNFKGLQEPSLVSYDKKGKIQLFYSFYGQFHGTYSIEIDAINLDKIIKGGRMLVETKGLLDVLEGPQLYNSDWALDPYTYTYVVVRNYGSKSRDFPKVAEGIQILRAPVEVINQINIAQKKEFVWHFYNRNYQNITGIMTSDDYSDDPTKWNGYQRVYNASIVSDEYGWLISPDNIEVLFTSSATSGTLGLEENQYLFSQMIHSFNLANLME
jgi:hypothetical protein